MKFSGMDKNGWRAVVGVIVVVGGGGETLQVK
jgi:hypothetical protein